MMYAFYQKTHKTHFKNITLSQLNHPSLSKCRLCSPDRTQKDPESIASNSMLSSHLMFTKSVSVPVAVSKIGIVLIKHVSQWTVLLGYLTNVRCYYFNVVYNNVVFQQDNAPGASCVQHSPTAAVQNSQLPFS